MRPLVLVAGREGSLARRLRALGIRALEAPSIRIAPPADPAALRAAVRNLLAGKFDWLVLTSAAGASALRRELRGRRAGARVAAVGRETARAFGARGADLLPAEANGRGLGRALGREARGRRFLLPRSDLASPELPRALRARGGRVTEVTAYRTLPKRLPPEVRKALRPGGPVRAVVFTSGSAARGFLASASTGPACIVSLGPRTSEALRSLGLRVDSEAYSPTPEGVARALKRVLTGRASPHKIPGR